MKTAIIAMNCIFILVAGCTTIKQTPRQATPDWVRTQIAKFQAEQVGNPPQSIWQYEYNGETVFYIPAQCCDQFSQLYDATGKFICAPDGGLSGKGDGKCPDFNQTQKNGTLIWRDPRSK